MTRPDAEWEEPAGTAGDGTGGSDAWFEDPVGGALSRALAVGLRVARLDERRRIGVYCHQCGAVLRFAAEPWSPQWTERRIDVFRYQHRRPRRRLTKRGK
jgi:hypothetical protein